jgi:hypothetical protein
MMNHEMENCRCGCIPKGMMSLFQMAEKRKIYLKSLNTSPQSNNVSVASVAEPKPEAQNCK